MTRPRKEDLTDLEHEATKHLGHRLAAGEISRMRGAASYPDRRVSHEWVHAQRVAQGREWQQTYRQESATVKKPAAIGATTPVTETSQGPSENPAHAEKRDPEPHEEASE